jgi:hypothetical protein
VRFGDQESEFCCLEQSQSLLFYANPDFLISEVQVYRIMQARKEDNDGMDVDGDARQPPDYIVRICSNHILISFQASIC